MPETTRILVVDDEPDLSALIRQKFRRRIRSGDLEFIFVSDGVEALEQLEKAPDIHLVLTDINMPRMDGLTLLAKLNEINNLLKAIVVSAYGDMENIRTAMNRGSFDFLTKPIDLIDLEITLNKALETITQQIQANRVRETFGRYLSDEVVTSLLADPEGHKLGGEKRRVTILMSDLRGFSTITETLPPEKVVEILNIYLGTMADVITEYKGTIDEFIGDAILVIFGAPIQREDDAARAIACALAMQNAMSTVNDNLEAAGFPKLEMGIGINTGEVVVGNIGSVKRTKYGVVGSHVNLTGRIESYTVGGQVLVSESTLIEAGPEAQIDKEMKLSAKGFSEPVNIYEVESIGAPFYLSIPVREEHLVELDQPWSFEYTVLDGKHMTNDTFSGHFTQLDSSGAVIRTDHDVSILDNLKMALRVPGQPERPLGDLYAKITEIEGGAVKIRFTAVPQEVAESIQQLIGSS